MPGSKPRSPRQVYQAVQRRRVHWSNDRRIRHLASEIDRHAATQQRRLSAPVVFFNSSTRLTGVSLNAAFSMLTSWALRLQGVPVIHFVCQAGMSRCILGAREGTEQPPPCSACMAQSDVIYHHSQVAGFTASETATESDLPGLVDADLEQLTGYEFQGIPLGRLVLPGIRWVMRRHHLLDDKPTRFLFREFLRSAYSVAREFASLLDHAQPSAVVIFNGQFFPEATARWVAQQRGLRVITYEVGLQPNSAFFTNGEATAYPLSISEAFDLSPEQNARLDAYLSRRFQGQFSMAGIQFWPEMRPLEPDFLDKAGRFRQLVPVFTNVIFDTSQPHSNVIFPHMFAWLDQTLEVIRCHPETLFVLRAHPDENRPGKASQESVRQWVEQNQVLALPNVVFYDSADYISSYELIQRAKFSLVYNSTIGLEAAIMGTPVLCGGRARFTQLPIVFFPQTQEAFHRQFEKFLIDDRIIVPPEFVRNARRFLYYQLFKSSLPFTDFIEPDEIWRGYVRLRSFPWQQLTPQASPTMQILVEGIKNNTPFIIPEEHENLYD